ncbi:integral membrane sensor signal transduction histidine kinase [Isoalcanivorax pacificus W11-5]|uniref:histidine kinase n=1 Tax=Isoalcanivorax pacificus W11-5 TaxID=391936 RepID=A0A0B4XLQ6_9GAMM|nr:integral membrane sensor signal transduction histidine kinase [Isoalcanivorax pacificus W11-5]
MTLERAAGEVPLSGHLSMFFDRGAHYTLDDILSPATAPAFTPLDDGLFGGFTRRSAFWLQSRLRVPPGDAGEWWLVINAPWVEDLQVWITPAGSAEVLWQRHSGILAPLSSRDMDISLVALRTELPAGEYQLWMRAAGERAISVQASFWQLQALAESRSRIEGLLLSLFGMMLLMVFIGLLLGWRLNDRGMVWYGVYVFGMMISGMSANGMVASLLLPEHPLVSSRLSAVAICFSMITASRVAVHMFSLQQRAPRLAMLIIGLGLFGVPGMLLAVAGYYGLIAPVVNAIGLVGGLLVAGTVCWSVQRHFSVESLLYVSAVVLYAIPVSMAILQFFGVIGGTALSPLVYQSMAVSHVFMVLLGMAVRISSLRKIEREAELERLRMAGEMRILLEQQVTERTWALHAELKARRNAERKLNDMLTEQRSFLAMVSHEFRTPLTVMNLVAYNIGRRHDDNDETREDVARVARANERLVGLVDACLSNEWLDSAEMRIRTEWQDLAPMLRELCEQRRIAAGREIILTLPEAPVRVAIDTALVQVVFDNLLGNAIKYSLPHTPISVSVRQLASGAVEVSVSDQGPGILPAEQAQIFDRYYRSPSVLSHTGIGLGLHIVRRVVTLHGGSVWLDPHYRQGARFIVRFPPPAAENLPAFSDASPA